MYLTIENVKIVSTNKSDNISSVNKDCRRSLEMSCSRPLEMSGSKDGLDHDERTRSATDRSVDGCAGWKTDGSEGRNRAVAQRATDVPTAGKV